MGFLEHLQSSLILGTHLEVPHAAHFDDKQIAAFKHALDTNDHQAVKTLIEEGFGVDTLLKETHETPLFYAIRRKQSSMALLLLSYGASIFSVTHEGLSLRALARSLGMQCIIDYLDTPQEASDIFQAALKGETGRVLTLLHEGESIERVNTKKQSLLHLAVLSKSRALVSFLLNRHSAIDVQDKYGNTPLMYATLSPDRFDILKLLVKRGATLDQLNHNEQTALCMSIKTLNFQAANLLVRQGANLNIRCTIHTPLSLLQDKLHIAQTPEEKKVIQELLVYFYAHGAHVNAVAESIAWSPLHLSVHYYDSPFYVAHVKKLLRLGAFVDHRDAVGRTPLMLASGLGRTQNMQALLDFHAQTDLVDKYGWSALMLAVYNNHLESVKLLIDAGCNVNLSSSKQLNALKIARDQKHLKLASYLQQRGAQEA